MSDCVERYKQRRDARLEARKLERDFREDYGVPGMKWGEHKVQEETSDSGKSSSTSSFSDAIKSTESIGQKMKLFKESTPTNNCGVSEKAFTCIQEAFKQLGETPVTEVEINSTNGENPSDKKLEKELQKSAEENGMMILEFKTKSQKTSRIYGYSPIAGGGASKITSVSKKRIMKVQPMM